MQIQDTFKKPTSKSCIKNHIIMAYLTVFFEPKANFVHTIISGPLKLLGHQKKAQVLKKLRKEYDFRLWQLAQHLILKCRN